MEQGIKNPRHDKNSLAEGIGRSPSFRGPAQMRTGENNYGDPHFLLGPRNTIYFYFFSLEKGTDRSDDFIKWIQG